MSIYGIILASGQSIRMGEAKLLLHWRGISLLEHMLLKTTITPFVQTKVVIPSHQKKYARIISSYPCEPIYNSSPQLGIGHSLALAIQSLPLSARAALILLADQPKLCTNDIQKVLRAFNQMKAKEATCPKVIIQMKYQNGRIGHPILFSRHFFGELAALKGDVGGKEIIRINDHFLHLCQTNNNYPEDIDTPDDYRQLTME